MKIKMPAWDKLINEAFIPLVSNRDRYLVLYGSRGSSKSDMIAKKLIKRCLAEPYFRYILYRKSYNNIKDSQFQTIKDIICDWGLEEFFTFTESPLLIRCINGNCFICRGGDEPKKLKSIKDPTGVWYEEEIPDESDFITITTSIRSIKAAYLQEVFTINPEVDGDYTEHWFWKAFFKDQHEKSFKGIVKVRLEDKTEVHLTYTVHHSTWRDNKWIDNVFKATLLNLKLTNPYYFQVYSEGLWANKTSGGNFYKLFNRIRDVKPAEQCQYNPELALHLTYDFNVNPYVTLNVHQMPTAKKAVQIDEICLPSPRNKTDEACKAFAHKYRGHTAGVFIYGDPAGRHEDTRTEKGYNDFSIISKALFIFRPQQRQQTKAPAVVMRGQFINDIFETNYESLEIIISEACKHTVADYLYLKEDSDGAKAKLKVKDKDTGITYEKYGHTSDANDYFYCKVFINEYIKYQKGSPVNHKILTAGRVSVNSY